MSLPSRFGILFLLLALVPVTSAQQDPRGVHAPDAQIFDAPDLGSLLKQGMRGPIERFEADLRSIQRFYDAPLSEARASTLGAFYATWQAALQELDFEELGIDDRVDFLLLDNRLAHLARRLQLDASRRAETRPFLGFAERLIGLQEARRRMEPVDHEAAALLLEQLAAEIGQLESSIRAEREQPARPGTGLNAAPPVVNRAASEVRALARTLESWYGHYQGYDPLFSWWLKEPHAALKKALEGYASFLREEIVGVQAGDRDTIIGDPIGRTALIAELEKEMIAYRPEELLEIAEAELKWCEGEMLKASRELGFGEDWRQALEHVKGLHLEPGGQPELVRQLAWEAIDFLEQHELVTIPELAKHGWRMEMMSPARQKFTPFFTGGEVVSVAFPTDDMSHAEKRMSLRSNNIHFSRATVHHELIPGHHLQGFMRARHRTYRSSFNTPFWLEGWALYWEMLLWDLDFQRSPEDRVGMLFWRMHRCARILFSLGFELGEMSPAECIQLLTERVGHEPSTAEAEVRRSVQGGYPPLYQAAYMLGGLQIRALHGELVQRGGLGQREFHDAVLAENSIPIELLRAKLLGLELSRDFQPKWRFYGD